MDLRPSARWVTPRSWSTENLWSNIPLKILPGVRLCIFLSLHLIPPQPSCTRNSDQVRHQTAALEQRVAFPLASVELISLVSHVAALLDIAVLRHACASGSHRVYRHGAAVQSNAGRQPTSPRFSISCNR